MSNYAKETEVPVARSRAEIDATLTRYGASAIGSLIQSNRAAVIFEMHGRRVRLDLPLPDKTSQEFTHFRPGNSKTLKLRDSASLERHWDQACRQRWRALALVVKAKLEAVESGITVRDGIPRPHRWGARSASTWFPR
jgi:hypothetical protein